MRCFMDDWHEDLQMKKLLLISALIVPTMASASDHCNAVSDFAVTVMEAKNMDISKHRLMNTLFEVKPPSVASQNELVGIIEWAYSIPYTIKSKTFAVDVYDSCMEFYYGN